MPRYQIHTKGPPRRASAYEILKSTGFHVDFGFHSGFLDFSLDFWISQWISGVYSGFLYFTVDFWISVWISADSVRDFLRDGPLGFAAYLDVLAGVIGKNLMG